MDIVIQTNDQSLGKKACDIAAYFLIIIFLGGLLISSPMPAQAQQMNVSDSISVKKHSPTRATIYSAVIPGLGQAYNKKYWKIPIIYAGFGLFTYFIVTNNNDYQLYKDAYVYVSSGDSSYTDNELVYKYNEDQLLEGRDFYRRNLELTIILSCLWYILQVVDASVDAHFFEYDISDDLSIRLDPMIEPQYQYQSSKGNYTGIRVTFKF